MEKYGDAKLPELRHVLANCPKAKSFRGGRRARHRARTPARARAESDRIKPGSQSALFVCQQFFKRTPPGSMLRIGDVVDLPDRAFTAHEKSGPS